MDFESDVHEQTERKETLAAIGEDVFAVAVDQPFRFPAAFTFVLRAFTTLEGLGKTLDPSFQFVTVAQPFAQELLNLNVRNGGSCPPALLIALLVHTLQLRAPDGTM